jgi:hypothetical protein
MTNEKNQSGKQCERCKSWFYLHTIDGAICENKKAVANAKVYTRDCTEVNPNNDCKYFEETTQ